MTAAEPALHIPAVFLPPAADFGGAGLFEILSRRRTTRWISPRPLPAKVMSNLLWSAFGINRDNGQFNVPGRTAGSASNSQEIDLYVAFEEGVYLYKPADNMLKPVVAGDLRPLALTPGQTGRMPVAPIQLIYVVDIDRLVTTRGYQEPGLHDPEVQKAYYYVDTGLIAQNVYLFASSNGLAAWFHNCDRNGLSRALALRPSQRVLFAQSVGYADVEAVP